MLPEGQTAVYFKTTALVLLSTRGQVINTDLHAIAYCYCPSDLLPCIMKTCNSEIKFFFHLANLGGRLSKYHVKMGVRPVSLIFKFYNIHFVKKPLVLFNLALHSLSLCISHFKDRVLISW